MSRDLRQMVEWATPRQLGHLHEFALHALAQAALGAGDFEEALRPCHGHQPAGRARIPHDAGAVGCARPDRRRGAHRTHRRGARPRRRHAPGGSRPPFAPVRARHRSSDAMVAPDDEAPDRFAQALALPGIEHWPFELARVQLAYGERMRRLRRTACGATPARRRPSTGSSASAPTRGRTERPPSWRQPAPPVTTGRRGWRPLTPQEREIAHLAATGRPTARSPRSCSCLRAPYRPTSTGSSPSSASPRGPPCATRCSAPDAVIRLTLATPDARHAQGREPTIPTGQEPRGAHHAHVTTRTEPRSSTRTGAAVSRSCSTTAGP